MLIKAEESANARVASGRFAPSSHHRPAMPPTKHFLIQHILSSNAWRRICILDSWHQAVCMLSGIDWDWRTLGRMRLSRCVFSRFL